MPFVQMFYGQPSAYLWQDDFGEAHTINQGEGGEQGDPLMLLLFSLGQHSVLEAVSNRLQADDKLMAFLDDVYVVNARPDNVLHSYRVLVRALDPRMHTDQRRQDASVEPKWLATSRV